MNDGFQYGKVLSVFFGPGLAPAGCVSLNEIFLRILFFHAGEGREERTPPYCQIGSVGRQKSSVFHFWVRIYVTETK